MRKCGSHLFQSSASVSNHILISCEDRLSRQIRRYNRFKSSLSFIPLRWMVKETIIAGTGILFKKVCLKSLYFDFMELASELDRVGLDVQRTGLNPALLKSPAVQPMLSPSNAKKSSLTYFFKCRFHSCPSSWLYWTRVIVASLMPYNMPWYWYAISKVYDQSFEAKHWWILESIPSLTMYQEPTGDWTRKRM